jgi:exopolyphosphatase/guanosine-5'-triphosphate,3'-diphosphate pyrophosphatase
MPGFSRQDQQIMWALVRTHRRSFKPHRFASIPGELSVATIRMAALLRLAVLLNRSRSADATPPLQVEARNSNLKLSFPDGWLDQAPLMMADLESEAVEMERAGIRLKFR